MKVLCKFSSSSIFYSKGHLKKNGHSAAHVSLNGRKLLLASRVDKELSKRTGSKEESKMEFSPTVR